MQRGKPAPDLFLHAADRMGVDPQRCIVVEDSRAGLEAAAAAGMRSLGYAAMTPPGELQLAGSVFTEMQQLPALIAAAT